MKRTACFLLSLLMSISLFTTAYAKPDWPSDTGVQSEAGIVVDMDSGAVLFGQNIHEEKIPASITKILTALIVVENSNLDDMVTFSYDAVYNVEEASGNKLQLEEGDVLSVRDCLYVMLLQSSNQAANALAEHVAGSREAFVDMMNERIAQIGCQESHFANPSGLNDDTQRTSAYDMALIARTAYQNPVFLEISSVRQATLPPTKNNPNGRTYSIEHKMLLEDREEYYPDAIAGKTGWTSQAGQTLVTYARRGDRGQIAVTLKSTQATHYSDTKTILDFGFARFKNVNISDNEIDYVTGSDPITIGADTYDPSELYYDTSAVITLPNDAEFTDAEKTFVTDLPEDHPDQAVARMDYTYNERKIGSAWLYTTRAQAEDAVTSPEEGATGTPSDAQKPDSPGFSFKLPGFLPLVLGGVCIAAALIAAGIFWFRYQEKKEAERRRILREKRRQRLADIGCSEEEFERLLEERRQRRDSQES